MKWPLQDPLKVSDGAAVAPRTRLLLLLAFALVAMAGAAAFYVALRVAAADAMVAHTLQVEQIDRTVMSDLQDAETGQRGYLLTGQASYLTPFRHAEASTPQTFAALQQLTADNPVQQTRLRALQPEISGKLVELGATVRLSASGHNGEALAVVRSGQGQAAMDRIRLQLNALAAEEQRLLVRREAQAARTRTVLLVLIVLGIAGGLGLAGLLLRQVFGALKALGARTRELEAEAGLRREAEGTLRQTQKMESVGQLAGGIAHDFNNLLTVILGNLDMARRRLSEADSASSARQLADRVAEPVELAMKGSQNAAQLTQRLLAFSRRQALAPTRLDLNRLVAGMSDMLRRTLGGSISIETILAGGLWTTWADANQVENALLNLAINAGHAMPGGGRLTIETANTYLDEVYARQFGDVAPGQYVLLAVTDTGAGIPPGILERVFEPFFTTRQEADGSGLGLAMVHGFVKQSGGHVRIYSEVGQGTTVKLYLPRLHEPEPPAAPAPRADAEELATPVARPGETVLVVEDNAAVRDYVRAALKELGYRVLEAADAAQAIGLIDAGESVSLLFTDVVLPGTNGRELSRLVQARRPDLPILFTTGYTRNAIVHHGQLDPDVQLLQKPYTQRTLALKVREMLDGGDPGR
jgi:signal transduction histidine kinase